MELYGLYTLSSDATKYPNTALFVLQTWIVPQLVEKSQAAILYYIIATVTESVSEVSFG